MFVPDSKEAMDFYARAFCAVSELTVFDKEKGQNSAKFSIGTDLFAIADENWDWGSKSPLTLGGVPFCIQLFVNDVRKASARAINSGAKVVAPGTDEQAIFTVHNTECCNVIDPFGFIWSLSEVRK